MLKLTDDELEANRSLPSFQEALQKIQERKANAERALAEIDPECPGAEPILTKTGFECPKCGLVLEYGEPNENNNHQRLMRTRHWNHEGNPFTENGMWGKAASSYDDDPSDWYMNH